jgi:hypothetical protein
MPASSNAVLTAPTADTSFYEKINHRWHKSALLIFMAIVLVHWAEHLAQAAQIYIFILACSSVQRLSRFIFSLACEIRGASLWICSDYVDRTVDAAQRIPGAVLQMVDDLVRNSVLAPHRTRAAASTGPHRTEPWWLARSDESNPILDSPRRTSSFLQYDRLHSDGYRHVLPHVSACS